MELSNLIPDNDSNWIISSNFLFYKKIQKIPVCYIEDNVVYISSDLKVHKKIIKIVKHLMKNKINFYFYPPDFFNPKGIDELDFKKEVIFNYLNFFSSSKFYHSFQEIEFDFIQNMTKWCNLNECSYLIKETYDNINKRIQHSYFDYYSSEYTFQYPLEIREEFRTLYRNIQISSIL